MSNTVDNGKKKMLITTTTKRIETNSVRLDTLYVVDIEVHGQIA